MAELFESDLWIHFEELMSRLRKIVYVLVFSIVIVMSLPADLSKLAHLDFTEYDLLVTVLMDRNLLDRPLRICLVKESLF